MLRTRPALVTPLLLLACALVAGCGSKGASVSGTVTFDGKPVPFGKIYFNPDKSKGNSGAPGYADIRDGSFDTSSRGGQACSPGAVKVRIEGFEEIPPKGEVTAKALFPAYETTLDLPAGSSSHKFDVPASAAKQQPPKTATPGKGTLPGKGGKPMP